MDTTKVRSALAVAEQQRGLLSLDDLAQAKLSRHEVATLRAAGLIERIQPTVYRVAGLPVTFPTRAHAAVLAGRSQTPEHHPHATVVASHETAATLLGLRRAADTGTVHVTAIGSGKPLLHDVTVHRTRSLDPCDVADVDGIPATTGARTLVDLAGRLDRNLTTALVDDAVCGLLTSRSWLYRRAQRYRPGRPQVDLLLRLTRPDAEQDFRSWLERQAHHGVIVAHGLPEPRWNHRLVVRGESLGIVDSYWPGLPVEWDGLRFHSTPEQRRADAARDRRMTIAGQPPLRYTWEDVVHRPADVAAEIREALQSRGLSTSAALGG